ncbi:MAG: Na(+)/H(+) antiporter subunit B [Verrucomicrobia bacterium CG_4_10_14_3_um_filter_43_23]|nr:MAG: Na(+)/H(+) antiporter subunit B [Verrucomicrobia bacterium CG1_02_43_26]PIP58509.1 MAG: Na(+)/H(+) antiporter subunit B [Verrucomicrobia bacterium CG22_combo_CG10-13_8_21_14_all_43_17]PIX58181.1 MAG: Na(+)/H(+) antiporter subunit B [Verrucomicrobia bacterium CG_4_10_14_3_um_filter_43_23]PIY60834.1 MAG: Na(+)/H(+) antiporter subunit B [Verrucomicrobia bacterium CG_4_10_14_0_8_um_filter_43_34]PJA44324.1 MAG: Na(+)/H(+) antiporter subunit B [Verrucomicrobia bacterium CG_4_9_14_3_um_filter_
MNSIIFSTATRFIFSILLLFSFFLLFRGHNEPGGGFTGGLVAAASFTLYGLAFDMKAAQSMLTIHPITLTAVGLSLLAIAGTLGMIIGNTFLYAIWLPVYIPAIGRLGTPLLFDVGVYLTVTGIVLMIIFSIAQE